MKRMIVTTSWDDGHKLDARLSALLKTYGIKATFYISPEDQEFAPEDRLGDDGIKQLAKDFEIGAHTMTHPSLTGLSLEQAKREIVDSKTYLERLIGQPVRSFCYPKGLYNTQLKEVLRANGFTYARTVEQLWQTTERGAFDVPTTVHAFSHWFDLYKITRFARWNPFRVLRYLLNWDDLAIDLFKHAKRTSGVFHLWGHSWELDRNNDWERLERVLKYIHEHADGVDFKTNGETADLYNPRRRVLTVSSYFPPYPGGLEKYACRITTELAERYGWDAHVLTTTHVGEDPQHIKVHRLRPTFTLSNTPIGLLWPIRIRQAIRRLRPDVIYAHMPVPVLGDIAARWAGAIPLVVAYHFGSMQKGKWQVDWLIRRYETSVLPRTLRRASALVASSDFVRQRMFRGLQPVRVVTPGVAIDAYTKGKERTRSGVLFVGNYSAASSHKGLLEAMEAVSRLSTRPVLTVVGYSDITPWYRQKAKELGITVRFMGVQQEADIIGFYRAASVLVLPSSMESYPMVIAEAMASGTPVVTYDVGGVSELVQDGRTGYLLPVHDVAGLQQRLRQLIDDPAQVRALGEAGQQWARQHLDWSQKSAATAELFEALLKGKS